MRSHHRQLHSRITSYNVCYTKLLRFLTVNLDWWNTLTAAQQKLIQTAADEVMSYSAGIYESDIADQVQLLKDKGCTVVEMSDAEFTKWWNTVFMSKVESSLMTAKERGLESEIKATLRAAAKYTNFNIVITSYSIHYTKLYDSLIVAWSVL